MKHRHTRTKLLRTHPHSWLDNFCCCCAVCGLYAIWCIKEIKVQWRSCWSSRSDNCNQTSRVVIKKQTSESERTFYSALSFRLGTTIRLYFVGQSYDGANVPCSDRTQRNGFRETSTTLSTITVFPAFNSYSCCVICSCLLPMVMKVLCSLYINCDSNPPRVMCYTFLRPMLQLCQLLSVWFSFIACIF